MNFVLPFQKREKKEIDLVERFLIQYNTTRVEKKKGVFLLFFFCEKRKSEGEKTQSKKSC